MIDGTKINEATSSGPDRSRKRRAGAEEARAYRDRFDDLVAWTRWTLWWEGTWPLLWRIAGIVGSFLVLSWLGLWLKAPPLVRLGGVLIAAALLLHAVWKLIRVRRPVRTAAVARLDRDSGLEHNPAQGLDDEIGLGGGDVGSRALWTLHRRRMAASVARMAFPTPAPGMPRRDRYAIRAFLLLAVVASAFFAGEERTARLRAAFDWSEPMAQQTAARIAGWIDPPLYTHQPPMALDFSGKTAIARAPVGSTIVVRLPESGMTVKAGSGLVPQVRETDDKAAPAATPSAESRFTLKDNAQLKVRTGWFGSSSLMIQAIPDRPPTITIVGEPKFDRKGGFTLTYRVKDDYGIASLTGAVAKAAAFPGKRTLVPPPEIAFVLPMPGPDEQTIDSTADVSAHGWAGALIDLTLNARDEAGQEGRSETISFTLPQKLFANPVAKALAEQRRNLIIDPDNARRVQIALDALLIAPEEFTEDSWLYLSLYDIAEKLRRAKDDAGLLAVADDLWALAVELDEGRLSESQRDLQAAQERLREAIERGASEEEINRLTQEYREAMQRYLRDFARQNRDNRRQGQDEARNDNSRNITSQELNDMLKKLEDAMKRGDTAEAERLLEELNDILNNLQMGEPGSGNGDPLAGEMGRSMNDLNSLLRDQQKLRDDTYNKGMRGEGEEGQDQGQNQGEGGQGQQQGGQQQKPGPGQSLTDRQEGLRGRLQELQKDMKGLGLENGQGFSDAERAMREAERALRDGEHGAAAEAQKRALQGLQRGARDMAQQMRDLLGDGRETQQGERKGAPQPGGDGGNNPYAKYGDGKGSELSPAARARRIIEELRRKLGEPERRREELDYFERLLPPN